MRTTARRSSSDHRRIHGLGSAIVVAASIIACGSRSESTGATFSATAAGAGGAAVSSSSTGAGAASSSSSVTGASAGAGGGALGEPIDAPIEQWTWVPIIGAECANGTPTGIGVNRTKKSSRVFIYLEGGGACWDEATCYGANTAIYLQGYNQLNFDAEIAAVGSAALFDRADPKNPLKDDSFVYVPYCTGDV